MNKLRFLLLLILAGAVVAGTGISANVLNNNWSTVVAVGGGFVATMAIIIPIEHGFMD